LWARAEIYFKPEYDSVMHKIRSHALYILKPTLCRLRHKNFYKREANNFALVFKICHLLKLFSV